MMPPGMLIGQGVERPYFPLSSLQQQRQACEAIKSSEAVAGAVGDPKQHRELTVLPYQKSTISNLNLINQTVNG